MQNLPLGIVKILFIETISKSIMNICAIRVLIPPLKLGLEFKISSKRF